MKKTNIITPMWKNCLSVLESKNLELADNMLMDLIFKLSDYTRSGYKDEDVIEGVRLDIWKTRAWVSLENNGLLPL